MPILLAIALGLGTWSGVTAVQTGLADKALRNIEHTLVEKEEFDLALERHQCAMNVGKIAHHTLHYKEINVLAEVR